MSQTNMVVVEGKITKVFPGKTEKAPARVSIKNVDDWQNKITVRYVNWTVFPNCRGFENIKEGNTVKMVGRIAEDSYEKNGQKVYVTSVIANSVEASDNILDVGPAEAPAAKKEEVVIPEPTDDMISEEEIPF